MRQTRERPYRTFYKPIVCRKGLRRTPRRAATRSSPRSRSGRSGPTKALSPRSQPDHQGPQSRSVPRRLLQLRPRDGEVGLLSAARRGLADTRDVDTVGSLRRPNSKAERTRCQSSEWGWLGPATSRNSISGRWRGSRACRPRRSATSFPHVPGKREPSMASPPTPMSAKWSGPSSSTRYMSRPPPTRTSPSSGNCLNSVSTCLSRSRSPAIQMPQPSSPDWVPSAAGSWGSPTTCPLTPDSSCRWIMFDPAGSGASTTSTCSVSGRSVRSVLARTLAGCSRTRKSAHRTGAALGRDAALVGGFPRRAGDSGR